MFDILSVSSIYKVKLYNKMIYVVIIKSRFCKANVESCVKVRAFGRCVIQNSLLISALVLHKFCHLSLGSRSHPQTSQSTSLKAPVNLQPFSDGKVAILVTITTKILVQNPLPDLSPKGSDLGRTVHHSIAAQPASRSFYI